MILAVAAEPMIYGTPDACKMSPFLPRFTDRQAEQFVGRILQIGVIASALVVSAGGVLYREAQCAGSRPATRNFAASRPGCATSGLPVRPSTCTRGVIQFGILLLILTPHGAGCLYHLGFFAQRDDTFVAITMFVLAVLLFSLLVCGCCRDRKPAGVTSRRQEPEAGASGYRCAASCVAPPSLTVSPSTPSRRRR